MFVRKVKKPNGHISVRVVKSERFGSKVRQKTLCCVGHCHGANEKRIAFFHRMGRNIIRDLKAEGQKELPGAGFSEHPAKTKNSKASPDGDNMVHAPSLKEKSRRVVGISDIFGKIYDDLNLSSCFGSGYKTQETGRLLKEIVLHRLERALSKRGSVSEIKRRGEDFSSVHLDRVYRMMDKVYENREALKNGVCDRTLSLFKERVNVMFFDVTTLYFESFKEDKLRSCGFSKDNKTKETQVVLALMTTHEGLPAGYELFPGKTFEGNTLIRTIDSLSKNYDIQKASLAADRGMFSRKNLLELEKRGIQFVAGARMKSMKKTVKEEILNKAPAFSKRGRFRKARVWTGEFEWEGLRLIVHYNRERAEKDGKDREKILEKIKGKMKNGRIFLPDLASNRGIKKYLKLKKKKDSHAVLDEEKIKNDRLWDGLSAIVANSKEATAKEILSKYRNLWQIEAAFRLNKHDLRMRPVYHWESRRIKAHILICFIAYGLAVFARFHLRRSNLKLSFEKLKTELRHVQVSLVQDVSTGRRFLLPSKINSVQKAVYKAFNKTFPQTVKFI